MGSTISTVEELVLRRRWLIEETKKFEKKYGIDSRDFYEKWSKGLLPEPLDPEVHGDFMIWYGLIEELNRLEVELEKKLKPSKRE
ncbi:MAG: hypothetical protein F7C38_05875 [Desulfurococcales archaeon]|nr:hypothetical protein [Desulfurococcales archaeon]